ncbi:MAG: Na+/H+ antiporter subunit E [Thermodesulfobacteriota bacterium]|nr:Na+/H+ antiporter subunit E [Thermodesulfobacteriota bacterium]
MKLIATFIILFIFWMVMAGKFDLFHTSLGIISCLIVTFLCGDLLFKETRKGRGKEVIRFIAYIPWLIYQIILANFHVARLALSPKMSELINPQLIRFKVNLKSDISKVTFANSITLTPGTITADIVGDEFHVHGLSQPVVDDLLSGEMEQRVAHIFSED